MLIFCILVALTASSALEWHSSSTFPNGTQLNVCSGNNATFPWQYSVNDSEHVINVEWYYYPQVGQEELLANSFQDLFFPLPSSARELTFIPNAGIFFSGVTLADSGTYKVQINLRQSLELPSQTAFLQVAETPFAVDNQLKGRILQDPIFDDTTGERHVQLECGQFYSLGQPPVSVIWKKPTNVTVPSTHFNNGTFYLTLINPVQGGDYKCMLDRSPAVGCIPSDSPLLKGVTIHVDEGDTMQALVERRLTALEAENSDMAALLQDLQHENSIMSGTVETLESRIESLQGEVQRLNELVTELQANATDTDLYRRLERLFATTDAGRQPSNCAAVQSYNFNSGPHTLYTSNGAEIRTYCDQTTDGGGWTVIQRRIDGSVDFYRPWSEYERGFGDVSGEFWIGLANLHHLTTAASVRLRIDLTDFEGDKAYAEYSVFTVSGLDDFYRMHVEGYNGTAGDSLSLHNDMQFTTYDQDHDTFGVNCGEYRHGAWWYYNCDESNLNGRYYFNATSPDGVVWTTWRLLSSLKRVEMKIKPL